MADKALSLQDQFLNTLRKSKTAATIFLVKGVKLQGLITWFDAFSLLLRRDGSSQLVYKHSISTIMPSQAPADLPAAADGGDGGGRKPALQDVFLQAAAREREPMTIFLVNGVMLQGSIAGFDQFSLILERGGQVQLVYKHAVSTMQPAQPLNLGGSEETSGDEG
jgi:host factor-I protein